MNAPRLSVLVHGKPDGIEAIRAAGLVRRYPPDRVRIHHRFHRGHAGANRWIREVHSFDPSLLYVINTASPGAFLAPLRRWIGFPPYILDTGDAVAAMARATGSASGWRLMLLRAAETWAQRRALAVVVRGSRHRDWLQENGYGRIEVIRDGYEEPHPVEPDELKRLRRDLEIPTAAMVIGVLGSLVHSPRLNLCYGWDVIGALGVLKDTNPPLIGLIVGDGPGKPWLEALALREGVRDRLRFTGRIPYARIHTYLRLMDVAVLTQTNNLPGQVRTTGKLPEYMAAGRFILASRVGSAASLLPEPMLLDYRGESDPHYPIRLARRIRSLAENPGDLQLGSRLPDLARAHFSYEVLGGQFNRLIESLSGSRSTRKRS